MAKHKAPEYSKLSDEQKKVVAGRLVKAVRAMAKAVGGGAYSVVQGTDVNLRARGSAERVGEDGILDYSARCRLLNMARQLARNSTTACAILKQFDLQGVGTVGGKASFVFEDQDAASRVKSAFSAWTRSADFYDGLRLNTLLKTILKTYLLGGDMVLVFDDRLVEDSGRVLVFEPDEIGDVTDGALARLYGKSARQSQGRIKNANGRTIGVIVSKSQRGQSVFDENKVYALSCDPNASPLDNLWIMPRNVFRKDQGRGVAPIAPAVATITDLEELVNYELQAAKKNSQTLAQVIDSADDTESEIPSAFAAGTDFSGMTDDDISAAVEAEAEMAPVKVSLDQIRGAGVIYEALPNNKRLELLDTKHPNANMPEFIRWLAGRSAAPFGLGSVYATMKADASYTAFRGEQVMSQPAFEEAQKFLEDICDWMAYRWSKWAVRRGIVKADDLHDGWLHDVSWQWPRMREVNQVDEQTAIEMKLRNGTGSYLEIYGPDWKEKLLQLGKEHQFCRDIGLPHPALQTVSGGIIDVSAQKGNKQ